MNIEENTQTTEELGATPAEVEQESTEEVAEETTEETTEESEEEKPAEEENSEEATEETTEESEEESEETEEEEKKEEPLTSEAFMKKAKELFPDQEFKDESEVYTAVLSRNSELEDYYKANNEANQKVMEVLTDQPEVGEIIKELAKGATFPEALALHVDLDAIVPKEGEPDHKAWKKAKAKRKEQLEEIQKIQKEIDDNLKQSSVTLETFRKAKEMSTDEINGFTSAAHEVIKDVQNGLITDKFLDFMWKGMKWEEAIAEGRKQGEIKGQNMKIEKKKAKDQPGDGLPKITSQGQPEKKKINPQAASIIQHQTKRNRFS